MDELETWVKKDGKTEVQINSSEGNIKAAKSLGWKPKEEEKKVTKKAKK